ncbi:MAG TPA: hypothetical protein VLZ12_09600 [Verrucomicrobiae bacterium]|nr:hypothetical protein [Verrucomicrobiae bacterium]
MTYRRALATLRGMNRLLFGNNLNWLRLVCHPDPVEGSLFPVASVDLLYLDPPFKTNARAATGQSAYRELQPVKSGELTESLRPLRHSCAQ